MLSLIILICSAVLSFALAKAGYGLDSWLFWVVIACYSTAILCALEIDFKKDNKKTEGAYYPPFKVGDTVYWAFDLDENISEVFQGKCRGLSVDSNGTTWFSVVYENGLTFEHTFKDYWRKTVFPTREEAEKKLRGRIEK